MKRTWPIIGVGDVPRSFQWYQALFGQPAAVPAHDYFGQILDDSDGTVLLCYDFDQALERARSLADRLEEEPHVNSNTRTREFSLRDPDGYYVTISALAAG